MTDDEAAAMLGGWLEGQGFESESLEEPGPATGNRVEVMSRGPLRARLVREGGRWFVDLGVPATNQWYDADVWRNCLEDGNGRLEPFQAQCRFVMRALGRVTEALDEPALFHCLRRRARDRVALRLGLAED